MQRSQARRFLRLRRLREKISANRRVIATCCSRLLARCVPPNRCCERRSPASETQQLQQNIVAELDKLIDQSKQSGSGGAAKSQAQRSATKKQQAAAAPKPKPGASARAGEGQNRQESQEDARRPQDVLAEVWGQLPEQLQKQIQSPVREQFLPQYEQLIIEYYKRLAEENRK